MNEGRDVLRWVLNIKDCVVMDHKRTAIADPSRKNCQEHNQSVGATEASEMESQTGTQWDVEEQIHKASAYRAA